MSATQVRDPAYTARIAALRPATTIKSPRLVARTDQQNTYVSIPTEADESYAKPHHPIRHRSHKHLRRHLVAITVLLSLLAATVYFLPQTPFTFPNSASFTTSVSAIEHLSQELEDVPTAVKNGFTSLIVGQHHEVKADYPSEYVWLDPQSREPFEHVVYWNGRTNSAIGRMPPSSPYDALVVARGWSGKYKDERLEASLTNLTVVGFFINWDQDNQMWTRAGPEPYILDLPIHRQFPLPCGSNGNGGPADPRFLWSDQGEPLAVIGTTSTVPGVCKAVGMVDLRAVWPGLKEHLEEIGYTGGPIVHSEFAEMGKTGTPSKYEKNWAAFFAGPKPIASSSAAQWPYFASRVIPRSIVQIDASLSTEERTDAPYVLGEMIDLENDESGEIANSTCLAKALPEWDTGKLHQATPFHRVTMCPRGTCTPTEENTVLMGIIHYKKDYMRYSRRSGTVLKAGSPEYDQNVVFAVSMAFFPKEQLNKSLDVIERSGAEPDQWLSHGWLDDTLVVGAGLRDEAYDSIHMDVETVTKGHTICESLI